MLRRLTEVKRAKDEHWDLVIKSWGVAPSIHNDFVDNALLLVSAHLKFSIALYHAKLWNMEDVIEINRGRSEEGWNETWYQLRGVLRTPPSLPRWSDILLEFILPDPEEPMDQS